MTWRPLWWLFPTIVAFGIYSPTIANGTIIDDVPLLHADLSLSEVAFEPGPPRDLAYYRPVTVASYVLLQAFGKGSAQVFVAHVSNVVLFSAGVLSVFWLGRTMMAESPFALGSASVAALLFAVHPIHTESVAWITARPDMLAGLFLVAALLAYKRFRETLRYRWLVGLGLASLAAPLSKEVGIAVFALVPAFEWLHVSRSATPVGDLSGRDRQRGTRRSTPSNRTKRKIDPRVLAGAALVVAGMIYLAIRLIVFRGLGGGELQPEYLSPVKLLGATGLYVSKLAWPRELVAFYAEVPTNSRDVAIGAAALLLMSLGIGLALVRRWSMLAFGLIWIVLTLAPSMPVFVGGPSNAPIAERYLYLPSIGVALCVTWVVAALMSFLNTRPGEVRSRQHLMLAAAAMSILLVCGTLAYWTVTRLGAYENVETFWRVTVRDNPSAGFARAGLAAEYARQGRLDEAEQQFLEAVDTGVFEDDARRGLAFDSLANVYVQMERYDQAVEAYRRGTELFPDSSLIHSNLAISYYNEAMKEQPPDRILLAEALREAQLAAELDDESQRNLLIVGRVAEDLGESEVAAEAYRDVLSLDASTAEAARANEGLVRLLSAEDEVPDW